MSAPMHICPLCEYLLVRAIKSRGLWDLVPQTAAQLRRYFLGFRREAVPTLQYYNPLAYAAGCLVRLRLDLAHIRPVTAPDPGGCPVCDLPLPVQLHWLSVAADCAQQAAAALLKTNTVVTLSGGRASPRAPFPFHPKPRKKNT